VDSEVTQFMEATAILRLMDTEVLISGNESHLREEIELSHLHYYTILQHLFK
jgi:hypothetical protein